MAGQGGPGGPNRGRVTINFVDYQERVKPSEVTLGELQESVGRMIPGATITVEALQEGPQQGMPVNIEIVGEDATQLKALSDQVIEVLVYKPVSPDGCGDFFFGTAMSDQLTDRRHVYPVYIRVLYRRGG